MAWTGAVTMTVIVEMREGVGGVQIIEVTDFVVRSAVVRPRRRGTALEFVLYPMVHMAKPAFYAAVTTSFKRADVVVAEGVDGDGKATSR